MVFFYKALTASPGRPHLKARYVQALPRGSDTYATKIWHVIGRAVHLRSREGSVLDKALLCVSCAASFHISLHLMT